MKECMERLWIESSDRTFGTRHGSGRTHLSNSMTHTKGVRVRWVKGILVQLSGYLIMKKNRIFFALSIVSLTCACQSNNGDYLVYISTEDTNIAYVISSDSGKYFVGENSWKFSVSESDFNARIYPNNNSDSISIPQLNFALPIDSNASNWNISNISCRKLAGDSESYQAKCVTDGRNETEFGYKNGSVVFFSAKCALSDKTCQYHLRNGIGFGNEIVKGWLAAAPNGHELRIAPIKDQARSPDR